MSEEKFELMVLDMEDNDDDDLTVFTWKDIIFYIFIFIIGNAIGATLTTVVWNILH